MNVVIIDNDTAYLRSLEILLENSGHQIKSFSDPRKGCRYILENNSIDALLLDYNMPEFSGEDLLQKVHGELSSECLIILISGHTDIIKSREIFSLGVHHMLSKPLNLQKLNQLLAQRRKEQFENVSVDLTRKQSGTLQFLLSFLLVIMSILVLVTPNVSALGQDVEQLITLDDYMNYAVHNNPELSAAYHRWESTVAAIGYAKSLPDPVFSYMYYVKEIETRLGPQKHKIGISQKVPWIGKLQLQKEIATENSRLDEVEYTRSKLRIFYEIRELYYEYLFLNQSILVTDESIMLWRQLEAVVRARNTAGAMVQTEMINAQVQLVKQEEKLLELNDQRELIEFYLRMILNTDSNVVMILPESFTPLNLDLSDIDLEKRIQAKNPDINAQNIKISRAAKTLELSKKQWIPDVNVYLNYIVTGKRDLTDLSGNGDDSILAGISFNLPFGRKRNIAQEKEAKLRYLASVQRGNDVKHRKSMELNTLLNEYRNANRKIDLYEHGLIAKAEQAFQIAQQVYIAGKSNFDLIIETQRELLTLKLALARAKTNKAVSIAKLELLIGETFQSEKVDEIATAKPKVLNTGNQR